MHTNPINLIPESELGKGAGIKLAVCDTEHDLYWRMAIEVLEVISENNAKGEDTIMVVPYGPLGPYSRLVYLVNKYRVSLKRCTFINMDEYLVDDHTYIEKSDPLSFPKTATSRSQVRNIESPSSSRKPESSTWRGAESASTVTSRSTSRRNPVKPALPTSS